MSSTTEQSISVSRVKDLLSNLVNSDVNTQLSTLGEKLKKYHQYVIQLRNKNVAVLGEDGKPVCDEIPVLDENGVQVVKMVRDKEDKKKKHEVLVTKKKVRHVALTEDELQERREYVENFKQNKLRDLNKKVSAFKAHKVKFSRDAIELLVTFIEKSSVAWLNLAADYALLGSKDLKEKIKIRLLHLLKSNFTSLAGIKAYFGKSFFEIMSVVHEEEMSDAVKTAEKTEKKRLKESGYTKGTAAREKAAKQRKNEALKKIQEEAERFKGLSNEEIARIKTEELLNGSSLKKKKTPKEEAKASDEDKEKIIFANAIKKNFKLARGNKYSIATEVMQFFENASLEFLNNVAGAALTELEVNETRTFDADHMQVFLVGLASNDITVSRKLALKDIEVPSEEALKEKRAERKLLLEAKKYAAPIDVESLPKETSYEAISETTFGGAFASAFSCLESTKNVLEEEARKKSEERKQKEGQKKQVEEEPKHKEVKKASKKAVKPVESDSDSDEEEQPVQVVKKTVKAK